MRPIRAPSLLALAGAVLAVTVTATACGSSSPPTSVAAASPAVSTATVSPAKATTSTPVTPAPNTHAACSGSPVSFQADDTAGSVVPGGSPNPDILYQKMLASYPGMTGNSPIVSIWPPYYNARSVKAGVVCPDGTAWISGHKVASDVQLLTPASSGGTYISALSSGFGADSRKFYAHPASILPGPMLALLEYIPSPMSAFTILHGVVLGNGDVLWYNKAG